MRHEKVLATEREKVQFLETRVEETLVSNSELRARLEAQECEAEAVKNQTAEDQLYISGLRDKCAELQETK